MNNKHRMNAKNNFEKDFFKLMDNSVFGKAMENIRNRRDIKLVTTKEKLIKYAREPNVMNMKCFSEDLLAVAMRKTEIKMNKPVYLGQSILDTSKTLVYEFYYNYFKKKYGDKVELCYTDTYSFFIHVLTEDFYKDISDDVKKRFDTSNYDKNTNRPIAVGINKKVLGMMKDELDNNEMVKSVNVCAILYSYLKQTTDGEIKDSMKAKGIKKCVKKQCLTHQDYVDAVKLKKTTRCVQTVFKTYEHWVFT